MSQDMTLTVSDPDEQLGVWHGLAQVAEVALGYAPGGDFPWTNGPLCGRWCGTPPGFADSMYLPAFWPVIRSWLGEGAPDA